MRNGLDEDRDVKIEAGDTEDLGFACVCLNYWRDV